MTESTSDLTVHRARWSELDVVTAYRLLQLRAEVFVVEQACAYLDLDGRDVEPTTWHYWLAQPDGPIAYLRVLEETGSDDHVRRIGRVVTALRARGAGRARNLLDAAIADWSGGPLVLDAQSHLVAYYEQFGFVVDGEEFVEDGIPHTPMRRP